MEDKNPQSTQQYWDPTQTNVAEADLEREVRVMRQKTKMRHRLIGGGVLLSTLLITLPMLFSEPSVQTNQQVKTKVPGIPSEPFGRLEFSVNSADTSRQPPAQVPLQDFSQPNIVDDRKQPVLTEPVEPAKKLPVEKKIQESPALKTNESHYFIQVLATSSEPGAMREMARYQAAGVPVYSVKVQKKSATIWRVRLGPFKTKLDADKLSHQLDAQKVQHMPVQLERGIGATVQKMSSEPTLKKTVTNQAVTQNKQVTSVAAKPAPRQTVSKASQKPTAVDKGVQAQKSSQKKTDKVSASSVANKSTVVANKPIVKEQVKNKSNIPSDPLADALKSVRQTDFIAEQIAKERAAQQRK